jgi:hypothetical protein
MARGDLSSGSGGGGGGKKLGVQIPLAREGRPTASRQRRGCSISEVQRLAAFRRALFLRAFCSSVALVNA